MTQLGSLLGHNIVSDDHMTFVKNKAPRVKAADLSKFNFNFTQIVPVDTLGDIGFIIEADYDLGFGYKMPWFTQVQYLVAQWRPYFKLGGIFHTAFHLYFMRVHIWHDLIGSELTLANFEAQADIMTYSTFCYSITAENQNLRLITQIEIDFNECMFGLFGVFLDDAVDC